MGRHISVADRRPDVGTARVDFPGGSAVALYESTQRILSLDGAVRVFSGGSAFGVADWRPRLPPRP